MQSVTLRAHYDSEHIVLDEPFEIPTNAPLAVTVLAPGPEYDLRGGVRGKYYDRYKQGTNVVLLEPDMAKVFRDSATVNEALRQYLAEHGTPPGSARPAR